MNASRLKWSLVASATVLLALFFLCLRLKWSLVASATQLSIVGRYLVFLNGAST